MSTIPASALVNINPQVIAAGGNAISLNGVFMTTNARVPIGTVLPFSTALAVIAYFGATSDEAIIAGIYFQGYNNATATPNAILFVQYPIVAVPAYLRGGLFAKTLAQLQNITPGTLTVTIDGVAHTSSTINLLGATSFSNAASIIQSALAASDAVVTGAIASTTPASVTGTITGTTLNVTAVSSGLVVIGGTMGGTGVTAGTTVLSQTSGTPNGIGLYIVSVSQSVASETLTCTYGTLTVSAVTSGTLAARQPIAGTGVTAGTVITQLGTGTGGTGTYFVNIQQTASSTTITAAAAVVTYDSQSGAFVITSGLPGAASTITTASTGSLATSLNLTTAQGAITSQGADATDPITAMTAVAAATQNWAFFMTAFEPSTSDKVLFASWANSTNKRFGYVMWDTSSAPTQQTDTTSAGYQIKQAGDSGTIPIYGPDYTIAAFCLGMLAAIDFTATNGRITLAGKGLTGIVPSVYDATIAANLIANGYNFYGDYATGAQQFIEFQPGSISGPYLWADSFANQIWLNNNLQLALMILEQQSNSIPYNKAGYSSIEVACVGSRDNPGPVSQAVTFGAIRTGVSVTPNEKNATTAAAGLDISGSLTADGYYFQVLDPPANVRQARGSPIINLWYMDGGSIQKITLNSTLLQ